ncbi:uncharacterized protein LOC143145351 isoform X2 [Ptiloglossa arizonensis]|uniref:uncharacterized protein LOC143145351 isoform X2 n=1 Tax=Ptiloglossa arizonensis TaxID=3350558 RepID=UPI003FA01349
MRKYVWILSALTMVVDVCSDVRRDQRGLFGHVERQIEKMLPYSSPVPFWQYWRTGGFVCNKPGYFPDPYHCTYYYKCTELVGEHLFRFAYRCNGKRVYSSEKRSCVMPEESDRLKCGGKWDRFTTIDQAEKATTEMVTQSDTSQPRRKATESVPERTTLPSLLITEQTTETTTSTDREDEYEETSASTLNELFSGSKRSIEWWSLDESTDEDANAIDTTTTFRETDGTSIGQIDRETSIDSKTLASSEYEQYEVKYKNTECFYEGFFGVSEDCSKFYRCVLIGRGFVRYDFACPRGTVWDDSLKTCNFRVTIKQLTCVHRQYVPKYSFPLGSHILFDSSAIEYCPVGNLTANQMAMICPTGFRRHPKYCNMFYQCISSDILEMKFLPLLCPENTSFDEERVQCTTYTIGQWRHDCVNFERNGAHQFSGLLEAPNTPLCPEEGRFPFSENCSSHYVKCKRNENGFLEGYVFKCPRDHIFAPDWKKCTNLILSSFCAGKPVTIEFEENSQIVEEI